MRSQITVECIVQPSTPLNLDYNNNIFFTNGRTTSLFPYEIQKRRLNVKESECPTRRPWTQNISMQHAIDENAYMYSIAECRQSKLASSLDMMHNMHVLTFDHTVFTVVLPVSPVKVASYNCSENV